MRTIAASGAVESGFIPPTFNHRIMRQRSDCNKVWFITYWLTQYRPNIDMGIILTRKKFLTCETNSHEVVTTLTGSGSTKPSLISTDRALTCRANLSIVEKLTTSLPSEIFSGYITSFREHRFQLVIFLC